MSTALLVMWLWAAQGKTVTIPAKMCEVGGYSSWGIVDNGEAGLVCVYPEDVPAVRGKDTVTIPEAQYTEREWKGFQEGCEESGGRFDKLAHGCRRVRWTCADKSRILLTAEDGSKHCIKFGGR